MTAGLNAPQREAIHYLDGPLLVLAGAGSGKTRVITQKIAYLIQECGYSPAKITAITFTNKAAREMKERAAQLLGDGASGGLTVSTFHALGVRILRQEAKALGLKPGFSILDASDVGGLFQELMKNADKDRLRAVQNRISLWKNGLLGPEEAAAQAGNPMEQQAAQVYGEYERTLRAYQAVDFDDLIRLPVNLFETNEEALARWQSRIWHLLVDEYQDTNRCQYRLMKLLAGPRASFTAVGDDDQSIYAWRGADIGNIHLLREDYPRLKVIKLEQNYRSTTRILSAANAVIAHNPKVFDKKLWSDHGHGDPIHIQFCRDGEHEAEWVAARLTAHRFQHRGKWSDYAILYRGNHQARALEQQLRNQKVPYALSGGQSFFERAEIKDITSYLRLLANQDDDPAFIRAITTPKRGIGGATLEALGRIGGQRHVSLFDASLAPGVEQQLNARQLEAVRTFCQFIRRMEARAVKEPASQILEDLLRAIDYEASLFETLEPREAESKWSNVRDFVEWLGRRGAEDNKNLLELAQTIALISMLDKNDQDADAVQLATLHAAKGLEFRHVFLVGVEEGILPHRDSLEPEKLQEERRLMYVGITRARMSLHLSHCRRRKTGREWRDCEPSRFIDEMGSDLRRSGGDESPPDAEEKQAGRDRLARFKALLAQS
ncbi:UvrD-helicase domain-containing protein [Denitratisoma oestradiolicum]|uniref:ATP-dependent DNA helicase Rep n=1 Tax=Denitratisoma oestradiolicum TaxID=311182 RepID=A0A6S6XYC5_9PROT|nr:UvrD-helicase domain-containing protein [Denitratisoma oestradiolicum]TWO80134.1 ATP-dependent DNA helicase Rep [Denitratisoma oestradiolicum]CAB1370028.1 ATP-dependent DNA helicase Rep [Denitratisoma oestradiolicum]